MLVEVALEYCARLLASSRCRILDIGTGSGAIGDRVWRANCREREIFATDISAAALTRRPRQNAGDARRGGVGFDFLQGDLFEAIRKVGAKFDLILSNPPYIRRGEIAELAPDSESMGTTRRVGRRSRWSRLLSPTSCSSDGILLPNGAVIVEIGADMGVRGYGTVRRRRGLLSMQRSIRITAAKIVSSMARHRALLEN